MDDFLTIKSEDGKIQEENKFPNFSNWAKSFMYNICNNILI